mmetsp:Transcript_9338/g.10780  ORF Transcript_9338/g.10780 Transcript_9338/m.10780 type:complete len:216 (+) Transcript_9338:202-849(+)
MSSLSTGTHKVDSISFNRLPERYIKREIHAIQHKKVSILEPYRNGMFTRSQPALDIRDALVHLHLSLFTHTHTFSRRGESQWCGLARGQQVHILKHQLTWTALGKEYHGSHAPPQHQIRIVACGNGAILIHDPIASTSRGVRGISYRIRTTDKINGGERSDVPIGHVQHQLFVYQFQKIIIDKFDKHGLLRRNDGAGDELPAAPFHLVVKQLPHA